MCLLLKFQKPFAYFYGDKSLNVCKKNNFYIITINLNF